MRAREAEARVAERVVMAERVEVATEEATGAERGAAETVGAETAARVAMAERVERAAARVEVERVEAVTVRGTVKRCAPLPG